MNVDTTNMTAGQRIMAEIISSLTEINWKDDINLENLDEAWESLEGEDMRQDVISEFREGTEETKIEPDWSRHFESKSVASQLSDGTWVGWTYWYGGGKYADPDSIDWINDAYFLSCTEEEKLVKIKTWSKHIDK